MASIECKAAGAVPAAEVPALSDLLLGLSGCPPAAVRQHETLMKGPTRERAVPELRLTHYLTALDGSPPTSRPPKSQGSSPYCSRPKFRRFRGLGETLKPGGLSDLSLAAREPRFPPQLSIGR